MRRDSQGRSRRKGQERGLRPLFPRLPSQYESRLLRAAMPAGDWDRLDAMAASERAAGEPTDARARGAALSRLLAAYGRSENAGASSGGADWLEWEMHKLRRLA